MKSIHQRIVEDIEGRIMDGTWPPGQRIPFEHELEAQYGCSRMTVNKALMELAHCGMIVRKRRAGSFVAPPQIDRTVMEIHDIAAEARLAGRDYAFRVLTRRVERLKPSDAARLGEEVGKEALAVAGLHTIDGAPHALEHRLILLDAVPRARFETFDDKPPGSWLLEQVPWSEARHLIRAVAADAATAKLLGIERGEPCLQLTRQTWQSGRTVTFVDLIHPGDRYQFAGTFRPRAAAAETAGREPV